MISKTMSLIEPLRKKHLSIHKNIERFLLKKQYNFFSSPRKIYIHFESLVFTFTNFD